jgi:hypothetical protein
MGRVSVSTTKSMAEQYKEDYEGTSGYQLVVFSDPQRADPADGYGAAEVLCVATDDAQVGIGGTFEVPTEGKLVKDTGLTFRGEITTSGTPTWACLCQVGDDLSQASTTAFRHDMTVGTYEDIPLPDIRRESETMISGNEFKVNKLTLLFPESVDDLN